MKNSLIKYSFILFTGLASYFAASLFELSALTIYSFLFVVTILCFKSPFLISPVNAINIYYLIFFIIAPTFADLYSSDDFSSSSYYLIYIMVFLTHATASFGAVAGSIIGSRKNLKRSAVNNLRNETTRLKFAILFLYIASTTFVIAIIESSGGIRYWIEAPGDAFLNRAGSGIYVVLSHFFTFCLASLVGYTSFITRKNSSLVFFLFWLLITSPVHGSKLLISIFLVLSTVPWLRNIKVIALPAVVFSITLIGIFFFGLYLRNISWLTIEEALPYALNYFTPVRNLTLLLQDFQPGFLQTFFLPFNKFLTPFGLSDSFLYYDMNHLLTAKYFPKAWEIRATEQWPVEADLYLNFYFFWGLPLIFVYTYAVGYVYGRAKKRDSLGGWTVSFLLTFSIVSHLRGSLYNHVDFYFYPMLFLIYFLLRKYKLSDSHTSVLR